MLLDLGKLRFFFAGAWNNTTTYETNDVVKYGGNVYVYINAAATQGNVPTNTTYWSLMVQGLAFQGNYVGGTAYHVGDGVAYGGKVYIAIQDSTNVLPTNATYWSQFADGIQYEGAYNAGTSYQKNDVVTYGACVYIAKQDTVGNLPTVTAYWDKFVDGISARSVYNPATAYVPGDLVAYGPNLYRATANTTGNLPTNATFWSLFVPSINVRGDWVTATAYYPNEVVNRGGTTYICNTAHTSGTWATDLAATKWTKFNSGIRSRGAWATGVSYLVDDIIRDPIGSVYICIADNTAGATFSGDAAYWSLFCIGSSDLLAYIAANTLTMGAASVTGNASVGGTLGVTGLSTLQSLKLATGATVTGIDTDSAMAANSDAIVPTQKAVKAAIAAAAGGSATFKSAAYTAVAGDSLLVDTRVMIIPITLPASPADGAKVTISDAYSTFDKNPCWVKRNGKMIVNRAEDLYIDAKNAAVTLAYSSTTGSWRLV